MSLTSHDVRLTQSALQLLLLVVLAHLYRHSDALGVLRVVDARVDRSKVAFTKRLVYDNVVVVKNPRGALHRVQRLNGSFGGGIQSFIVVPVDGQEGRDVRTLALRGQEEHSIGFLERIRDLLAFGGNNVEDVTTAILGHLGADQELSRILQQDKRVFLVHVPMVIVLK